jgi:hypothetical protein
MEFRRKLLTYQNELCTKLHKNYALALVSYINKSVNNIGTFLFAKSLQMRYCELFDTASVYGRGTRY